MVFKEYDKIQRIGTRPTQALLENDGDVLYIEEKIDGANFRFMPTNGRIIFGSHHQSIGDTTQEIGGNFKCAVDEVLRLVTDKDLTEYDNYIFFGECTIPHTVTYDRETIPPFIAYDILASDGKYIDYDEKINIFARFGFPIVHLVEKTTAGEFKNRVLTDESVPRSAYGHTQAEGIVIKNYKTQTFLKYVCTRFLEVKSVKSSKLENHKAVNDDEKLIQKYCTIPRVEKKIFDLHVNGHDLDMPMMQYLPKLVWQDIVDECANDVLNENWKLDLKNCRKLIAAQCKILLEININCSNCL